MSVEEDVELRDLVAQTLESNGCLAKIKAQLRASMFLALDEDLKISKQEPLLNKEVTKYLETNEGQAMFCIVREFLEFFKLKYTITVYEPESYGDNRYKYEGKEKIIKDLGLTNLDENGKVPLLWQLIKIAQMKTKSTIEINLNVNNNNNNVTEESIKETISNTSNNKTESNKNSIETEENGSSVEKLSILNNNIEKNEQFNATFIVSEPIDEQNDATNSKTDNYKDDTYDDTSSIAEDGNNFDKIDNGISNDIENHTKSCTDEEILEFSPPIVKDKSKSENSDKSKLSQKQDKLKKGTLADLPPLPITKPHVNDILPSLYSKELKEKSNLRELNKLFDIEQEYEEDFMSSSSIDLSLQSTNHSSKNGVDSKMSSESNNSIQRNLKTSPNNGEIDELATSTQ